MRWARNIAHTKKKTEKCRPFLGYKPEEQRPSEKSRSR
jgi:hypothetical protein